MFVFTTPSTTEISTLSLHDALPILIAALLTASPAAAQQATAQVNGTITDSSGAIVVGAHVTLRNSQTGITREDRKSTRLNSSHLGISYAVFCLKKKNKSYRMQNRVK